MHDAVRSGKPTATCVATIIVSLFTNGATSSSA